MKYIIVKPIINKANIVGYEVVDSCGEVKRFKLADLYKLIEAGLVDCKIVNDFDGNKHILYDVNRCPHLEDVYYIKSRIVNNGELVGYVCKLKDTEYKLTPTRLWELASENRVANIKAIVINNRPVINGDGLDMEYIDTIEINT